MSRRPAVLAALVVVLGVVAFLVFRSDAEAPRAPGVPPDGTIKKALPSRSEARSVIPRPAGAPPRARPNRRVGPPLKWDELPPSAGPGAQNPLGLALAAWAKDHPTEGVRVLPMNCDEPPCVVPVLGPPGRLDPESPVGEIFAVAGRIDPDFDAVMAPMVVGNQPAAAVVFVPKNEPAARSKLQRGAIGRQVEAPPTTPAP